MIKKLRVKNFASIKDSGEVSFGRMNVLIGQNSSGKSNLLGILRITKQLSKSHDINDIFSMLKNHFSPANIFHSGDNKLIEVDVEFLTFENKSYKLTYSIAPSKKDAQNLTIPDEALFKYEEGQWLSVYKRLNNKVIFQGRKSIPIKINNNKLLLSYYDEDELVHVSNRLASIFSISNTDIEVDNHPYVSIKSIKLEKLNDITVYLYKKSVEEFEKAVRALKKIIPYFESVRIRELLEMDGTKTSDEAYLVHWKQGYLDLFLESSSLSSGDRRTIYIMFALFILRKQSTVTIEEIENGIHIGRINSFIDQVRTQSDNRNMQIILTTHSREILESFLASEVIFCNLDKDGSSKYRSLESMNEYKIINKTLGTNQTAKDYFDSGFFS